MLCLLKKDTHTHKFSCLKQKKITHPSTRGTSASNLATAASRISGDCAKLDPPPPLKQKLFLGLNLKCWNQRRWLILVSYLNQQILKDEKKTKSRRVGGKK